MTTPSISTATRPIQVEPHYSTNFYAELWGVSRSTVERWFEDEPGVLRLSSPGKNGKKTRIELRIPWSVAQRVYQARCGR